MKQSDNLTKFYRAYLAWATDGAPIGNIYNFFASCGLCYNSRLFANWQDRSIRDEMIGQFIDAGLDAETPFNVSRSYANDTTAKSHHLNTKRMAWVREHAAIPLSTEV